MDGSVSVLSASGRRESGPPELVEILKKNHLKLPVGRLKRAHSEITLTYDAEFKTIDELKQQADYVTTTVDDDGIFNALRHLKVI